MEETANIGLHQWAGTEPFLREDFNEDFRKIDGAVGERSRCKTGVYTGNGIAGRQFSTGFRPKTVWLFGNRKSRITDGVILEGLVYCSLNRDSGVSDGELYKDVQAAYYGLLTDTGFTLVDPDWFNNAENIYGYVALG